MALKRGHYRELPLGRFKDKDQANNRTKATLESRFRIYLEIGAMYDIQKT